MEFLGIVNSEIGRRWIIGEKGNRVGYFMFRTPWGANHFLNNRSEELMAWREG